MKENKKQKRFPTIFLVVMMIASVFAVVSVGIAAAQDDVYVTTNTYDGLTYYIQSNGDGTFGAEEFIVDSGGDVYGIGMGDFDNDGDFDIVTPEGRNEGGQIVFIEKLGSGNDFAAPVEVGDHGEGYPMDFAVADFNNDGNLDFVFDDYYSHYYVFIGNGDGTFTSSTFSGPEYEFPAGKDAADFNMDGNMDFAVALESQINLYLGNGDGTFTLSTISSESYNVALTAGDFDSDGIADIIAGGSWHFYRGIGDGTFEAGVLIADMSVVPYTESYSIDNFDFDNDGLMDVMILGYGWDTVYYFRGNGDGTFTYETEIATAAYAYYGIATPPTGKLPGAPYAIIEPEEQTIATGDSANFDGSASYDEDGSIVSWDWDFGDDTTGTGDITSHVYDAEGTHTVKLTVMDNDGKKDRDFATVYVIGDVPVANANGPYAGDEGWPVTFDGSGSFDTEGIVEYEWDFGDGASGYGMNPTHTYLGSGEFDVTLTVYDAAHQSDADTTTASIENAVPVVVCAPWQDGTKQHPTWSGKEITLKGTVIDTDAATYEWDFGDGTGTETGTVTDIYAIQASHAYTGEDGTLFTATLTVWDDDGASDSDTYNIIVKTQTFNVEKDVAIDEGLWGLHKKQNRYTADEIKYGSWGSNNKPAYTSAAVQAFENQMHLPDGNPLEDPYVETVQRGLNYILSKAYTVDLDDEYDSNGNEIGIGCNEGQPLYEVGMVMMGIVASENKHRIAITGPEGVIGREYQDIVQDMVDYLSWAQNDNGGWRYQPNSGSSDNSVTQWPVLGLEAAETQWDIEAPDFVKEGLDDWLEYSQNDDGGFGYDSPTNWVNIAKTGAGIAGLVYIGYDVTDERPVAAFDYIDEHWETDSEFWGNYYTLYSVMKACTIPYPPVEMIGDHNWYAEIGQYLIDEQNLDGCWPWGSWSDPDMTTAWSIQILTKSVIVKMPVADANGPYESDEGFPVYFDGSGSYHQNPYRDIVLYEWDFESDGVFDFSSTEPDDASHVYGTYGTYMVTLRVTDNNDPSLTNTDTAEVWIHEPPHSPTADANGPYEGWIGVPVTLDGSGSYDPNDDLINWEWDLDGDGEYDDASGEIVEYTWSTVYSGNIGLKVTDSTGLWDTHWTTVAIGNHPPVADANGPYEGGIGIPITFDGSGSYDPDEAYGDYIVSWEWDLDGDRQFDDASGEIVEHTWDAEYSGDIGLKVTDSYGETDVDWTTVNVGNLAPIADADGPYSGQIGEPVLLDGSGSYDPDEALGDEIVSWDWDLDEDGYFDDASGETVEYTWDEEYSGDICLRVTDLNGAIGTDCTGVTISGEVQQPELCPDEYRWNKSISPNGYEWDPFPELFRSWNDVHFMNSGPGDAFNVVATISYAPANVNIVDGDVSLGDIPAGSSAWSSDFFELEVDMTYVPLPSPDEEIEWTVEYDDSGGNHHVIENVPQFCAPG